MGARDSLLRRQRGLGEYQTFHSALLSVDSELVGKRQVIEMLFDGLAASLCGARHSISSEISDLPQFNQCVARSRRIIAGLLMTLESVSPKSDIGEQLASLYRYWMGELDAVRPHKRQHERLDALIAMVAELRQAWR